MTDVTSRDNPEGRLCGVLAAAIARHVTALDEEAGPGRKGAVFVHFFVSSFEHAAETLEALGLLVKERRDNPSGRDQPECPHVLAMDAEAMPDFVAGIVGPGDERIPDTIGSFVAVACEYAGLSSERAPFVPPPQFKDAMRALARFGYAEAVGDTYRWTGLIGPAMREFHFWDDALNGKRG